MVTNGKSTEATNLPSPAHGREPALSGRLGLGEDTKGAEGEGLRSSLDRLLSDIDPSVARAPDKALAGEEITRDEATTLLHAHPPPLPHHPPNHPLPRPSPPPPPPPPPPRAPRARGPSVRRGARAGGGGRAL